MSSQKYLKTTKIDVASSQGELSTELVLAVAELLDTDPESLPPLAESVDPDVVQTIFETTDGDMMDQRLTFGYAGQTVNLYPDGLVTLMPEPSADSSSSSRITN